MELRLKAIPGTAIDKLDTYVEVKGDTKAIINSVCLYPGTGVTLLVLNFYAIVQNSVPTGSGGAGQLFFRAEQ